MYRRYDAFVSASLGEGLGLPVVEAVLAALPVVANRWSGHADTLASDGCFSLPYKLIEQPFSSDPSYLAAGQRCAYSSPAAIGLVLKSVASASARLRKLMARRALAHLLKSHGTVPAVRRLRREWARVPD